MIKEIHSSQLRVGMYLHKLGVSWLKHPFVKNAFLIESGDDVRTIREHGIDKVWIDTDRGIDVGGDEAPAPASAPEAPAATDTVVTAPAAVAKPKAPAKQSMQAEVAQARKLCNLARREVVSMFNDARMGKVVKTGDAMPLVEEISASVLRNPSALISVARIKTHDQYTYLHSIAVCALMVALARQAGLDEAMVTEAGIAGLMHDLGKAVMPLEVLNKPGKLTDAEYDIMKTHPEAGWKMLREAGDATAGTLDVALHHHEKVDGTGYPKGLAGEDISLLSRMGAICDVYDAVTSNRPYKAGWCPAESLRRMASWKGHFDERLFKAFVRSVGIYPVGALVRTKSDKLGVIIEQNEGSMLTPRIRVFFSARSNAPIPQQVIDLASPACREQIAGIENPQDWGLENLERFWLD
ncbi:HD-GYP domain-containing protein [Nitrogeniibacter mangrovi]|uniref:HD-GYP domain-containing protein n=1 Tax=Nitrogeniibacter mangrovi TaxID=2016596 RepID=A0A6C1B748_9RHOO|nr:HD-GYP domain-containing protein [Nitrogeniibacter mangrovi]QID19297.1 HD-GYP domain-containing protein [Nitrogeniibacter mangrovi]